MGVLEKLPTFATMCVLVLIFACLKRHTRSARLTLWAVGWTLVFTHFLAQLLEPDGRHASHLLRTIDAGALQAAAVAFLVSVSSVSEHYARRTTLLLLLAWPSVTYAILNACDVSSRWPYVLCLVVCFAGGSLFFLRVHRKISPYVGAMILACSLAGAWAVRAALRGSHYEGAIVLLATGFAVSGVFSYRNNWGASPAVLTISGGFLCWGSAFPILLLIDRFAPGLPIPRALWDAPKLFVAFGMILAVVEDKSKAIAGMRYQAERLNRQLERFSGITSRLLSAAAPDEVCPDIAAAITDVSSFRAVVIHIADADGGLGIAGSAGLSGQRLANLQAAAEEWTADRIRNLCDPAHRIGKSSFSLNEDAAVMLGLLSDDQPGEPRKETYFLLPLWSAVGACLGSVTLVATCSEKTILAPEFAHIESLAADLAVAVEMRSLHTQLVWSEKLAALGQLVAGVAHELNNPLTAIMGYSELLGDALTSGRTRDHLTRLMNETRRMRRITDNLLHFSRRGSREASVAHFSPVVQEVLTLCEYYTRKSGVSVAVEVAPGMPPIAINEDEIKQILLNLFNNSCDALNGSAESKQITIRAVPDGADAVIQVEDTGPGFANLQRALDPFYTTKPVGKGTGLGLSICYGIAKKRGGDLRIENVHPHGSRVTLRLPLVQERVSTLMVSTAHA